jgi:hypothetical protein
MGERPRLQMLKGVSSRLPNGGGRRFNSRKPLFFIEGTKP